MFCFCTASLYTVIQSINIVARASGQRCGGSCWDSQVSNTAAAHLKSSVLGCASGFRLQSYIICPEDAPLPYLIHKCQCAAYCCHTYQHVRVIQIKINTFFVFRQQICYACEGASSSLLKTAHISRLLSESNPSETVTEISYYEITDTSFFFCNTTQPQQKKIVLRIITCCILFTFLMFFFFMPGLLNCLQAACSMLWPRTQLQQ